MSKVRFNAIEKLALITEFEASGQSNMDFARSHGLDKEAIKRWQALYKRDGIKGLKESRKCRRYSEVFKLQVVYAFLNGEGSQREIAIKYGLRSSTQVNYWVSKYNRDKTVTATPSRKQVPKMGRKTTLEERIKIVKYITEQKHSYQEAAERYDVSYQQTRLWVLKAKEGGYEALKDRRGQRKSQRELTDLDKANQRIKQLERELADKELLEEFVKKFQELQHRG
ncbi:helix-turn-helix domain-containing protein [Levilactobacillus tujiorum]|uniref:Helix-turn-helix domain-containing protein n=1 Tax=Levilactobacillus tujiorum TaxID=2912243 RepID=A0ABX1LA36_9LACO|nr:helix-turn-helix domain-containing protein [Levilactobacillus tujiorum]MCH5465800.1 helix-turn-helix domain-containing protein [Levilactobacillus tujiorum]NLR13041.1 helix-turn-helix domain-containing protein [Lactobacillus sp. HBUAS51387]NLR30827.1 helix-turn-helix domain-containing protein [Levilactobacillus tujiorum]